MHGKTTIKTAVDCTRGIQEIMFTVFYFTLFYTDEGAVTFRCGLSLCRTYLPSQNKSEYFRCPSLAATGARRSAVRHWYDGVLVGDHRMVRGQDCGVNAATLCIQIYDILCERVTVESHYCVALLLWQYGLVLVNLCNLGF
jgi:hypothetical protein